MGNLISSLLIIIPIGTIYVMFVQHFNENDDFLSISVFIILLLFNILCFNAYLKFNRYLQRERENAVYTEQLSMISQNMEEQKKLMEEFYAQKHDLINELTVFGETSIGKTMKMRSNIWTRSWTATVCRKNWRLHPAIWASSSAMW